MNTITNRLPKVFLSWMVLFGVLQAEAIPKLPNLILVKFCF